MKLLFILSLNFLTFSIGAQVLGTFVDENYTSGKYSTLKNFDGNINFSSQTYSGDISVFTYKNYAYLLEVDNTSRIHKFSVDDYNNDLYAYNDNYGYPLDSTNNFLSEPLCVSSYGGSDPVSIAFISDNKAYLVLYNYNKLLIVNPSATSFTQFKLGEIDLSDFADSDNCPEARSIVIIGNKAYLSLQLIDRNNSWAVSNDAKVIEINTETDTVENVLTINGFRNPNSELKTYNGYLFISFQGPTYPIDHSYGGLVRLNPTNITEETTLLSNMSITHFDFYNEYIYFLDYVDWQDVALKRAKINDIENTLETAFGFDGALNLFNLTISEDKLWLVDRSSSLAGFHLINLLSEEVNSYTLSDYIPYSIAKYTITTNISPTYNDTNSLTIFPNPASTELSIKSPYKINKISIINASGLEFLETTNSNVNLRHLPKGLYFIRINTDRGIFIKKLIIK